MKRIVAGLILICLALTMQGCAVLGVAKLMAPEADTAAPSVPDTGPPQTQSPQTQSPQTQSPQTQSPQTQSPQTQAPPPPETTPDTTAPAPSSGLSAEQIYELVSPSVVEIRAYADNSTSTGTGFFCDDKGTVITNFHVIEGCHSAEITTADGKSYTVKMVMGYSAVKDIAILSTSCRSSAPLTFRTTAVKTGETVYAIGSSLGLTGSLSNGIISSAERKLNGMTYIQTTAPISHGNSGGPLIDKDGMVIGITTASFSEGQNLNLAVPISEIETLSTDDPVTMDEIEHVPEQDVNWISDWEVFHNDRNDCYVLLFRLSDQYKNPTSADGYIDVRIVNDLGVTVFDGSGSFGPDDFDYWSDENGDTDSFRAELVIEDSKILSGHISTGTLYFTVYGNGFSFEEVEMTIEDLPV